MKCVLIAFAALAAVASAGVYSPAFYSAGLPLAYSAHYAGTPYVSSHVTPYVSAYAAPYAATYAAAPVAVAPAIQSGYVAATRGSVHTAPLPEGPFAASHHINTAPAPGTF